MRLIATVGNDIMGRWLQESFGGYGPGLRVAKCPTCISIGMTHPNGERTFFTYAGHLELFGPDDILPFLPDRAPDGSVALLVAVFLSPPFMAALTQIIAALRAANYSVALDTGWPPQGWTDSIIDNYVRWLAEIDTLLVNEVEATALARTNVLDEAVTRIRAMMRPDATLVVKRGADGASAWRGAESGVTAAPKVVVADSIGAGDVFNVGFLRAKLRGATLAESLKEAVSFASAVIATRPRRYDVV
jgi:sugar/nucleoside kinase (ribokinase family)